MNERPRPAIVIPADAIPEERDHILALHVLAALSESMCPTCAGDLQPDERGSRRPWLHCQNCVCYWQADHERQEWTRVDPSSHDDWRTLG